MNTKTKVLLVTVLVVAAAAVGAYFIFRSSSTAYLKALPKNVIALARLDVKEFMDDADLSQEEIAQLSQRLSLSDDEHTTIGLNLTRPVYGFASQDGYFGVLAAVADVHDVTSWCERLRAEGHASEVSQQRGYSWVVLEQQWLMAFDGERALAMGPAVGAAQDQLRTIIARLMGQERDDSALETELYETINKKDDLLTAVVKSDILPEEVLQPLRTLNLAAAAQGLYLLSLDARGNELALNAEILPDNEDGEDELEELNQLLRPIRGSLTDYAHSENLFWMAVNLKGEDLLQLLRMHPAVRTALVAMNFVMDVDRILESIDGDIAVEIISGEGIHANLGGSLTAQVSNIDFLSGAKSWGHDYLRVQPLSATEYFLEIPDMPLFFSVNDKTIHLGSERAISTASNAYLREEQGDIKGARFYATIDLQSLPYEQSQLGSDIIRHVERLDVRMERVGEFAFTLKAAEDTNILKTLLNLEL